MCGGMFLRTLNVGKFEGARFAHNKGFTVEITAAGATGDFENSEVCVEQSKHLEAIITCLDNLNQFKQSYYISMATI